MTSIAKDRGLEKWAPDIIPVQLAAGVKVFYGTMIAINANGLGVPGSASLGLTFAGAAQATVDNTEGDDGEATVHVLRPSSYAFKWVNDGTISQAHLLKMAYMLDNQTVSATDGGATRSVAGRIVRVESDGVWVQ